MSETFLIGTIKTIIFQKDSFFIAILKCDNLPEKYNVDWDNTTKITGSGIFNEKVKYKFYGNWENNTKYGMQFKFDKFEEYIPDKNDLTGIEKYLSSGLFKGIGPSVARKIVSEFGENTLYVLNNEIDKLLNIKGISKKKLDDIKKSYQSAQKYQKLVVSLSPFGVSVNKITKIIETYGENVEYVLKENPYQLCKDIDGFGFITADTFALANGMDTKDIKRVRYGIKHILSQAANMDGHTYLTERMLAQRLSKILNSAAMTKAKQEYEMLNGYKSTSNEELQQIAMKYAVTDEIFHKALFELEIEDEVVIERFCNVRRNGCTLYQKSGNNLVALNSYNENDKILISNENIEIFDNIEYRETIDGNYVKVNEIGIVQRDCFLKKFYNYEKLIAMDILRLIYSDIFKPIVGDLNKTIEKFEKENKITYATNQKQAIIDIFRKNVLILTGGPGTGKTTTLKGILDVYSYFYPNDNIMLAAPTGRAAKRMTETTGRVAKTAHRLLEFGFDGFSYDRNNPLECDLLVLDESSMFDVELFYCVIRALKDGCKLLIVGDENQLPSVGPGSVLHDLIASNNVPTICLNEIFRQKGTSLIVVNANKINKYENNLEFGNDFEFISEDNETSDEDIAKDIIDAYKKEIAIYGINNVQVLVPFRRKTIVSVNELNKLLEPIANPSQMVNTINYGDIVFKENDRVMQMSNDYTKNVFNGDIGIIKSIVKNDDEECMFVDFDGELIKYIRDDFENLVLAYATTIHKSQGSEYSSVIVPILKSQNFFLNRSIFYTAITRAKKKVTIIGQYQALQICINKNNEAVRKTKLSERFI